MNSKSIDPIDIRLGARIRERREELGVSQEKLARGLGISFQQIQKYEKGVNRVSVSRLVGIAQILETAPADLIPMEAAR